MDDWGILGKLLCFHIIQNNVRQQEQWPVIDYMQIVIREAGDEPVILGLIWFTHILQADAVAPYFDSFTMIFSGFDVGPFLLFAVGSEANQRIMTSSSQ